MAWIELHQSLWTHRKTFLLAAQLGIKKVYAAAHLARLWTWCLDNAPDGDLSGLPNSVIAFGADWDDDPDMFVEALKSTGWLDEDGKIHDWHDYAGRLIEKREANKERARKSRERNAQRARNVRATNANVATLPNHTKPINDDDDIYTRTRDDKFAEAYRTFEQHFGLLNPTQTQTLEEYIDAGMEPEVIEAAAQETRKRGFAADYFFGILENCITRGILTLQAFREDQMRFEKAKANKARASPEQKQPQSSGPVVPGVEETRRRIEELSKPVEGGGEIPPHVKERLRQIVRKHRHA